MTEYAYRRLVARLERSCDVSPRSYRHKVLLLAALGHAYVLVLLGGFLALLACGLSYLVAGQHLYVGLKLLLIGATLSALLLRALWVSVEPPGGRLLPRAEAPQLFALIARLRARENGPEIHELRLSDEFNAAIVQTPRWGLFGGHRNCLIIGLPLMQAMSPKAFAAVVAHEYGHLAGAHGKAAAWVYRTRQVWMRLDAIFRSEESLFYQLFTRFFRWYFPYFNAYSFVLARQHEYEADQVAARLVGAEVAAQALVAANLRGRFMSETFWPGLLAQAERMPSPHFLPYSTLRRAFRHGTGEGEAARWLKDALAARTGYQDTHPCLRDRLDALGQQAPALAPLQACAARYFLGASFDAVVEHFDRAWLLATGKEWAARHRAVAAAQACVANNVGINPQRMTVEALATHAKALHTLGRHDEALPLLRRAAGHSRGSAETALLAGCMLLEQHDADGIKYLELAMDRDRKLIREATWRAWRFYEARSDELQASYWAERLARL